MSSYIQIPNSITTKLTKRSKHEEAFVYALIKDQIKDNSRKASIAETELATLLGKTERTVSSYISTLKSLDLFLQQERKLGSGEYPYNVYQFSELKDDYFVILPPFLYDTNLSPKLKGLLLFIKANCWKGTNYLNYIGKTTDLPAKLGVGKNHLSGYLDELEAKRYIRFIGNSLHIINENFPLFLRNDMDNITYKIIYEFCLSKNTIPPIKNVDNRSKDNALSRIVGVYQNENDRNDKSQKQDRLEYGWLRNALNERCKNLPKNPSLRYFCQALCNKKPPIENYMTSPIIYNTRNHHELIL